jgi:hypothetical protein
MTQYTAPMGGTLSWGYQSFTYTGAATVREVNSRSMNDSVANNFTNSWTLSHPSTDSSLTYHSSTDIHDNGAGSHKVYGSGTPSLTGISLVVPVSYQEESSGGPPGLLQKAFTWTQDSAGNAYVGTVASTLNPGTSSAATSQTVQTLDIYGNLIQQQLYDYPGNPVQSNNS